MIYSAEASRFRGAGRDACHRYHGMIRIFKVEPQPAFYIIGSTAKPDKPTLCSKAS